MANEVELLRPCGEDETLLATASIDAMRRASVRIPYRVFSREKRDLLVRGAFVFACVGPEGPRPYNPQIHRRPADPAGEPVRSGRSGEPGAGSAADPRPARWFDALLPRSFARGLRLTYWHFLSLRGSSKPSPAEFVGGLVRVLRSSEGREVPAAPRAVPEPAIRRPILRWSAASVSLAVGETGRFSVEVFNAGPERLVAELESCRPSGSDSRSQRPAAPR